MLADELAGLHGVLQGLSLGGILLGFHQQPAFVLGLAQQLQDGIEVHAAVTGNGEGAVADSLQEAPVVLADLLDHIQTHILQVHVANAVSVLLQHQQGVLACEGEVAGVVAQEDVAGIGVTHHAVGLVGGLHDGAHVVMEAQLEATVGGDLAQLVQAVTEDGPLLLGHHVLVTAGEDGGVHLALDGVALLADVDAVGTDGGQEVQLLDELGFHFLVGLGDQEAGEPAAGDAHAAQVQVPLQLSGVLGVLVADLAAGEASQSHLADDLTEGVLGAQLGHIIIAPADGGDAKMDFFLIEHISVP